MPGSSETKPGTAVKDRILAEREQLQRETRRAIREWAESIDTEDAPRVVVNVEPPEHAHRRSLADSLRPLKSTRALVAALLTIAITLLAALVRSVLESHGIAPP